MAIIKKQSSVDLVEASNKREAESLKKAVEKASKKGAWKEQSTSYEKVDWVAKDRSQLVGGRSHDAAELVHAAYISGKSIKEVLVDYKEALTGILNIADEVK